MHRRNFLRGFALVGAALLQPMKALSAVAQHDHGVWSKGRVERLVDEVATQMVSCMAQATSVAIRFSWAGNSFWIRLERISEGSKYWVHTMDWDSLVPCAFRFSVSCPASCASLLTERIVTFLNAELADQPCVEFLFRKECVRRSLVYNEDLAGDSDGGWNAARTPVIVDGV